MKKRLMMALATGALVAAMAPGVVAAKTAQDSSTSEHPLEHPFVGAWVIHPFPNDPSSEDLVIINPGGTVLDYDSQSGTGVGAWTSTGDRTADLSFDQLVTAPDGSLVGLTVVRASVEVAKEGQSFTGTWTLEFPPAAAEMSGVPAGELGPGDVTGERIAVESPGPTVGPMPGASNEAPPSPEASPAS